MKTMSNKAQPVRTIFGNHSQYDRTYNNAIDMSAHTIGYYRRLRMPVKALHLKTNYYELFRKGIEVMMRRELRPEELLEFDGARIENGGRAQVKEILVEFYPLTGAKN